MMMNTEGLPIQLSIVVVGTDIIRNSEDGRSQYLKHIYIKFMYPLSDSFLVQTSLSQNPLNVFDEPQL